MKNTTEMTSSQIRAKWTPEKLAELSKQDIPEFSSGITDEDRKSGRVPLVGRGFAVLKQYINRNGRPRAENPRVGIAIRIPLSYAALLRETGPGWQTRVSEFVTNGIESGHLVSMKPGHPQA
ncbi:MAG: BrnA antitoxin family protein [Rickettsiales bacterium]|jgi:uncharacterized protein (DUF4415 family)|nr:BrnA antitoxin family protein [Rickettsiales bacterium]